MTPATDAEFDAVFPLRDAARRAAFDDAWLVLNGLVRAEAAVSALNNTGTHDERQTARIRMFDWERELRVVSEMYQSVKRPPPPGSRFYVTTTEGHLVAGPYETHESALRQLPEVKRLSRELDSNAVWLSFGTSSVTPSPESPLTPGFLNPYLELTP